MVRAFERVFGATIFFSDESGGVSRLVNRARFHFMSEARIWYEGSGENEIVLSDDFYREVTAHPIPVDLEAVKVLAATPGALDLLTWLTYRCFCAKQTEVIPLLGPTGLAGQLGVVEYSRPRRFRSMIEEWLERIKSLWPTCPCRIEGDRLQIRPSTLLAVSR